MHTCDRRRFAAPTCGARARGGGTYATRLDQGRRPSTVRVYLYFTVILVNAVFIASRVTQSRPVAVRARVRRRRIRIPIAAAHGKRLQTTVSAFERGGG